MKVTKWTLLIFAAGMLILGSSYALSESSWFDDRVKYPDAVFATIQDWCNAGMIVGGAMTAYALFSIVKGMVSKSS